MSPLFFSSYLPSPSGQTAVNEILVRSRHSFVRWQCHLPPPSLSHRVVRPLCFFLSSLLLSSSLVLLPVFFLTHPSTFLSLSLSLLLSLHRQPPPAAHLCSSSTARERVATVFWSVESRGNGVCVRRDAEGWWLKWGGVQSDYAKLCPYVLAWKFHPSPGLPPAWENVFIVVCPAFCIWPPTE